MATLDEQRDLSFQNAKADERLWSTLRDTHEGTAADHEELAAKAQAKAAQGRARRRDESKGCRRQRPRRPH
jgi:hypothetical protein